MDNFISTIVFTLPGLACYYWLQWFGFTSSQKHSVFEMAGISALLWIPVSGMTLFFYNLQLFSIKQLLEFDYFAYITNLDALKYALGNLWFILYFCIVSILFSYLTARMWIEVIFKHFLQHINIIRVNNLKIPALSNKPTVWEEIFMIEGEKVVKLVKLDKPDECIIGSIRKTSRPLEPERHIVLDEVDYFTKLIDKYNPIVKHVFFDTKSGIAIYMYHPRSIIDSQNLDNSSNNPIVSPWASE